MNLIIDKHEKIIPTLKYELRSFMSLYPELFFPLVNFKASRKQAVNRDTEIVIEGFPRSGNSFSVGAFESVQNRSVKIAHHLHAPAQIIVAARQNIPAILLIRNPIDAVISMKALDLECSYVRPPRDQKITSLIKSYIHFYQRLIPYQDRYIISLFETTINDFGSIIEKVNIKFNTDFQVFNHSQENVQKVFDNRGFHAGPNERRQAIKQQINEEFNLDYMQKILAEATATYQKFVVIAKKQEKNIYKDNK